MKESEKMIGVSGLSNKVQERRLHWYRHVMRKKGLHREESDGGEVRRNESGANAQAKIDGKF